MRTAKRVHELPATELNAISTYRQHLWCFPRDDAVVFNQLPCFSYVFISIFMNHLTYERCGIGVTSLRALRKLAFMILKQTNTQQVARGNEPCDFPEFFDTFWTIISTRHIISLTDILVRSKYGTSIHFVRSAKVKRCSLDILKANVYFINRLVILLEQQILFVSVSRLIHRKSRNRVEKNYRNVHLTDCECVYLKSCELGD